MKYSLQVTESSIIHIELTNSTENLLLDPVEQVESERFCDTERFGVSDGRGTPTRRRRTEGEMAILGEKNCSNESIDGFLLQST